MTNFERWKEELGTEVLVRLLTTCVECPARMSCDYADEDKREPDYDTDCEAILEAWAKEEC